MKKDCTDLLEPSVRLLNLKKLVKCYFDRKTLKKNIYIIIRTDSRGNLASRHGVSYQITTLPLLFCTNSNDGIMVRRKDQPV